MRTNVSSIKVQYVYMLTTWEGEVGGLLPSGGRVDPLSPVACDIWVIIQIGSL